MDITNAYIYVKEKGNNQLKGVYFFWYGEQVKIIDSLFNQCKKRTQADEIVNKHTLSFLDDVVPPRVCNDNPITLEKLNKLCIEYGGETQYLYDDDDKWKYFDMQRKIWLPVTQDWIDKLNFYSSTTTSKSPFFRWHPLQYMI